LQFPENSRRFGVFFGCNITTELMILYSHKSITLHTI
jgi:hypothetical protein